MRIDDNWRTITNSDYLMIIDYIIQVRNFSRDNLYSSQDNLINISEPITLYQHFFSTNNNLNSAAEETASFPADVSSGENDQKLRELNFPDEDVPEKYLCPISRLIMSDPVYLNGDKTGQRFERNWITKWLTDHRTHPITRQIFQLTELQSDSLLATEINEFVKNAESKTQTIKK